MLALDLFQRVGARQGAGFAGIRDAQYVAPLQPVDVVVREGFRIGAQERQHHLLDAHRCVRAGGGGNRPQCVARPGRASQCPVAADGRRGGCGGCPGGGRGRDRRGRHRGGRRCRGDRLAGGPAGARIVGRRVEQRGVFAYQPPLRPVQLQQEIEVGLADGIAAGDLDVTATVRIDDDLEGELVQLQRPGYAGPVELRVVRKFDLEVVDGLRVGAKELDPPPEGLVETGVLLQPAEPQSVDGSRNGDRQRQQTDQYPPHLPSLNCRTRRASSSLSRRARSAVEPVDSLVSTWPAGAECPLPTPGETIAQRYSFTKISAI